MGEPCQSDSRCAQCGYALLDTTAQPVCPECGSALRAPIAPKRDGILYLAAVPVVGTLLVSAVWSIESFRQLDPAVALLAAVVPAMALSALSLAGARHLWRGARGRVVVALLAVTFSCGGSCGQSFGLQFMGYAVNRPKSADALSAAGYILALAALTGVIAGGIMAAPFLDAARRREKSG